MTIYYLYVKTHNITGLKYLGFTKKEDPHKYTGSGKYWLAHLKKHGRNYTTEILKECSSKKEIKELGTYYSNLWNIVLACDKYGKKTWANEKLETADGIDSETASKLNKQRVKNGTHHLLGPDVNFKRVQDGTHNWLDGASAKKFQLKRVEEGTHHWLGDKNPAKMSANNGTHHWLGDGEYQRSVQRRLIENGSHHFVTNNPAKIQATCPHCNKTGGQTGMKKWHFDNCKLRDNS